jgi:hypothetical protein
MVRSNVGQIFISRRQNVVTRECGLVDFIEHVSNCPRGKGRPGDMTNEVAKLANISRHEASDTWRL